MNCKSTRVVARIGEGVHEYMWLYGDRTYARRTWGECVSTLHDFLQRWNVIYLVISYTFSCSSSRYQVELKESDASLLNYV